ncbi:MAG: peptidoglycan-binding protein [Patescibacteria group bacterium]|nr:peptidoglycan-binding protein [Patescibacteria group bacterium]
MKKVLRNIIPVAIFSLFVLPLAAHAASRTMVYGMSGSDVRAMQGTLIADGYLSPGSNTGYFGSLTLAAVKKFQCDQNIVCSGSSYGIVGPHTQAALASGTVSGSTAGTSSSPGSTGGTGSSPGTQPSTLGGALTPAATGKFEISGWVPSWRAATATADTAQHLSQLTSIMPFGYHVNTDGQVVDTDNVESGPWPAFIAAARTQGVRVVPSIEWGNGEAEQAILSDSTARVALEDQIANLAKQNNYDGVDIDFEAKKADTINYFSTFLKGLYQRMGNKWLYCTIEARQPLEDRYLPGATIPSDATDYANDYAALNKYCDRVEIMAYDQGTIDLRLDAARSAPYAPVADLGWVSDLINLAAQSISRNKLVVGVPTYGYEYSVTPQGNGGFEYSVLWPFNPAYGTQIASQLGITPTRTSADEIGFVYNPSALQNAAPTGTDSTQTQQSTNPANSTVKNQGSQVDTTQPFNYVTWSDAKAIQDKVQLAHQLGIRGVAVFSLGGAEDPAMWNVLK